ncbi:MAG: polymer-forming cytoskeletal protein [Anaerovoracaceae bacterium]
MSTKDNAKQAWKEILGVVGKDADKAEDVEISEEPVYETKQEPDISLRTYRDAPVYPMSVIADGMTVDGDAKVQGDLELRGAMKGNITADGNVTITGKLLGDLNCSKDVILISAMVQGNITVSGVINLDKASTVIGDIEARSANIDGKMKGSLVAEDAASFQKDAVLIGDVTSGKISMSEGAQIVGALRVNVEQVSSVEFEEIDF